MRFFLTDKEPEKKQLDGSKVTVLDAGLVGQEGYFVAVEGDVKPEWLGDAQEFNVPGEPHRCPHCGVFFACGILLLRRGERARGRGRTLHRRIR